jgi:hypothetical protein
MTLLRMRQHLGAIVWRACEAIRESPRDDALPALIRELLVTGLDHAIDAGYVAEQSSADTHILPDDAPEEETP